MNQSPESNEAKEPRPRLPVSAVGHAVISAALELGAGAFAFASVKSHSTSEMVVELGASFALAYLGGDAAMDGLKEAWRAGHNSTEKS